MRKTLFLLSTIILFTSCGTISNTYNNTVNSISKKVEDIRKNNYEKRTKKLLSAYDISIEQFQFYREKNDQETRLIEFKDDDHRLIAKIALLNYINISRNNYNRSVIKLDILASRTANKMSKEAAESGFMGHWNLRGEKPYHRYSLAGGVDHIAENAAAIWSSEMIINSIDNAISLMKESHNSFMQEIAPNDGHKKNVLEPQHNFVGLGYSIFNKNFRYYEEYIDRYLKIEVAEIRIKKNHENRLSLKPINPTQNIYAILVYKEAPLQNMNVEEINRKNSYTDFSPNTVIELWPWDLPDKDKDGFIKVNLKFSKPGTYYVQCYVTDEDISQTKKADTSGKIQASGVVYYVD